MTVRVNRLVRLLAPCVVLALPAVAWAADEPRYTYAELGYVNTDFDDIDVDGDGFRFSASYALHRNVHLVAGYEDTDLDRGLDAQTWNAGIGLNFPLRPGLDAVGRARYIDFELDTPGRGDPDEDGYGLEGLVRAMIGAQLEINGGVRYVDIEDDETSLVIGALYEVAKNFVISAELDFGDDVTTFFIGGRLYVNAPRQLR
jgi:hypothetical protein